MLMGNIQCRGILLVKKIEGKGHPVLVVGAGVYCLDIYIFSRLSGNPDSSVG